MDKLFLLDAYALIYRAYYGLIKSPRINSKGMNTSAIFGFVNTLEDLIKKEKPTHLAVAFDPAGPTFRHEMYEQYKAQREATPEDIKISVPIIKEILAAYNIPVYEVKGYEADDVIGTLATKAGKKGIATYMVTPDKDYGQLAKENVFMYRPVFGKKDFAVLGVEEVKDKFKIENPLQVIDLLGLMGDAADNIPGCPGVGEKTAQKLLTEFGSIENLLANTDKLKGAIKKKVEENKKEIEFSKFLATIKIDVPVELNMDEMKIQSPNAEALGKLFEELEFKSLIDRVLKKEMEQKATAPKNQAVADNREPDLFGFFADNSTEANLFSTLDSLENIKYDYQLIDKEDDMDRILQILLTKKIISIDTETTGTDPITAQLVGMSFSYEKNQGFYVPVPAEKEKAQAIVEIFRPLYENEQIEKVGQNIKYDIILLGNYGVSFRGKLFDTMLAHYVLQPELHHNMDYMAETYLNYNTIKIEELIGNKGKSQKNMRDLSPADVYKYACEDTDVTLKLKEVLEKELKENNQMDLFEEIEMPLVSVLAYMERNGVRVDTENLKESSAHFTQKMRDIEKEIYQLAGTEFNIASPKQVGEILFDRLKIVEKAKKTKTGQYVTSEEILEGLRSKHEIVNLILEHRGLKKLLSTYIDALPAMINPATGKIHTSFNQAVTATGRLSSSNPNLQNIPIRDENGKEIRKAFVPDEGCEFFSADYSQIELRIMAHLSEDPHMIEAFNNGDDIHAATAAKIYKVNIEEVTKEQRSKAKTANFGIIYGISVFGLAERLNIDRKEAKELIDGYFSTYTKIKEYMDKSIEVAKEKGYIETIYKRKRFLPDINSRNSVVRGYAERNAINAPIQGSAADIIKIAMIRIYNRFMKEGIKSKMILQVHDELNFSVLPEEKEKVEQIVISEMESAYKMKVPLLADSGWGQNWLEAH